jgi:hypothetical protein
MIAERGHNMNKYLIQITGTSKYGKPVQLNANADDISITSNYFSYWDNWNRQTISFYDYYNINVSWQSDGFSGHLAKIIMGKEQTK